MEKLLHYVWRHRMFPDGGLVTTTGKHVEILSVGHPNSNQGPDFFNARIAIEGQQWAGNVEIHLNSSDWKLHNHHTDINYNNVILHVVGKCDTEDVKKQNGEIVPQIILQIPGGLQRKVDDLLRTDDFPRCHRYVFQMDKFLAHSWLDALLVERLQQRSQRVLQRLDFFSGDWERVAFVTFARSLGFGLNGDSFEMWAGRIPLQSVGRHSDNLLQVQAFFLGMAGLLDEKLSIPSKYNVSKDSLIREWQFLANKFSLTQTLSRNNWRYLRTRPQNFPEVRILQFATLYHYQPSLLHFLIDVGGEKLVDDTFSKVGFTKDTRYLIFINAVTPLLYAYGMKMNDDEIRQRAISLLENLPAENNFIMRQWHQCGLEVNTAADSQALIQLKREYCDHQRCLCCRFGYEYLNLASHE